MCRAYPALAQLVQETIGLHMIEQADRATADRQRQHDLRRREAFRVIEGALEGSSMTDPHGSEFKIRKGEPHWPLKRRSPQAQFPSRLQSRRWQR